MTEWHDLIPVSDLAPGELLESHWRGSDLLLYRSSSGECRAITGYCPHMGNYMPNGLPPNQPLSTLIENDELRCPYHGWRFNDQGQCSHIPPSQSVPSAVRKGRQIARVWPLREQMGMIQIRDETNSARA
ncbi:MAG: Rieske (2Fe-2S) protein [Halioglobus sp.]